MSKKIIEQIEQALGGYASVSIQSAESDWTVVAELDVFEQTIQITYTYNPNHFEPHWGKTFDERLASIGIPSVACMENNLHAVGGKGDLGLFERVFQLKPKRNQRPARTWAVEIKDIDQWEAMKIKLKKLRISSRYANPEDDDIEDYDQSVAKGAYTAVCQAKDAGGFEFVRGPNDPTAPKMDIILTLSEVFDGKLEELYSPFQHELIKMQKEADETRKILRKIYPSTYRIIYT
jgi:hypothetical protein